MNFLKINTYYKVLLFVFIFLFFAYNKIYASLEITEIMYAPENGSSYEWIEVYNSSENSINLNKYRFFHGEENSGPITIKSGGAETINGGEYFLILKSMSDYSWASFSCPFFSASTLSLPDSGDNTYIAISDSNKNVIDSLYYDTSLGGNKKNKTSLSKIDNEWMDATPSPCVENISNSKEIFLYNNIDDEEYNTSYKSSVLKTDEDKKIKIITTTAKIISDKTTIAGLAVNFDAKISNNKGIISNIGRFVWNFGDGTSTERDSVGVFDHVFWYPGEYVVVLNYYKKGDNEIKASDRVTIKVLASSLNIYIGSLEDPYIELENKSSHEINLSNWKIKTINKEFLIPNGTFILPNKKIKISPKITGFNFYELSKVEIFNPNGEIMSFYPKNLKNNKVEKSIHPQNINTKIVEVKEVENSDSINLNENLKANALTEKSDFKINFYLLGLFIVILLGIFVIVLTNRNNIDEGDEISAKNFKILE